MDKNIQNIAVLTSGGDSPGMNAAIRAVVRCCAYYKIKCTGIFRGYEGLIEGDFKELNARSVKNLINRGGTFLKSTRSPGFMTKEGRHTAHQNLKDASVDALIVIGGNGTFKGAHVFQQETDFPVIGIPATIDNDIFGTDFTIGYDTALNTVVDALDKIRDTANSHNRIFLVEVMGRDAGDIALNSGIAGGAEEILIPENNIGVDKLLQSLKRSKKSGKTSSIVVVSEGETTGKSTFEIADYLSDKLPDYDIRVTVLGHIQRGGAPSCYDRVLASRLGIKAVETLINNQSNLAVGVQHKELVTLPIQQAFSMRKRMDEDLLKVADITSI